MKRSGKTGIWKAWAVVEKDGKMFRCYDGRIGIYDVKQKSAIDGDKCIRVEIKALKPRRKGK